MAKIKHKLMLDLLKNKFNDDIDEYIKYMSNNTALESSRGLKINVKTIREFNKFMNIKNPKTMLWVDVVDNRMKILPKVCKNIKEGVFRNNSDDVLWCLELLRDIDKKCINFFAVGKDKIKIDYINIDRINKVLGGLE